MWSRCCGRGHVHDLQKVYSGLPEDQRQRAQRLAGLSVNEAVQDQSVLQKVLAESVKISAEKGDIKVLKILAKANIWEPSSCNDVVWAAEQAGTLMKLAQHFTLPLASSPTLDLKLHEVQEVLRGEDSSELNESQQSHIPSTRQAMLLANLMMVPNVMAREIMDEIVEDMIVFEGKKTEPSSIRRMIRGSFQPEALTSLSSVPKDRASTGVAELVGRQSSSRVQSVGFLEQSLDSLPLRQKGFPERLGAIFLHRRVLCSGRFTFDKERLELKDWPEKGDTTKTSPVFDVDPAGFADAARPSFLDALVPMDAAKFAYWVGKPGAPGGFVYFDNEVNILAVNSIAFDFRGCALSFGPPQPLSKDACQQLEQQKRWFPLTVQAFLDKGAISYAFVGPNDTLGPAVLGCGGFAYRFENQSKSCFFPIISAGEVMYRAIMPSHAINAAMAKSNATGSELESIVRPQRNWAACRKRQEEKLVRFARLNVAGILHPVVLRSVAFTPCPQVLSTNAAQAITQTAFDQHVHEIVFDVIEEVLSLLAIMGITWQVRKGNLAGLGMYSLTLVQIELLVVLLVWMKNVCDETCHFLGCYYQGWVSDYFDWQKFVEWAGHFAILVIFIWVQSVLVDGSPVNPYVRPLLGTVGAMSWIRVLYAFRGTVTFRLGPRILPIISALGDVTDFVLITMFFSGACAHTFFALSVDSTSWGDIMFSTYHLAFLADVELPREVFFMDEDEEYFVWSYFQYVAFVVFSFVISIALTNIFIGVMSNAFDYYSDRVEDLLKRTRALIALEYTLRAGGRTMLLQHLFGCSVKDLQHMWTSEDQRLWFCYRRDADSMLKDESGTMRGTVHGVRDDILHKLKDLGKLEDEVRQVASKGEKILKAVEELARQAQPSSEGSRGDAVLKRTDHSGKLEDGIGPIRHLQALDGSRGEGLLKMEDFSKLEDEVRQMRQQQASEESRGEILRDLSKRVHALETASGKPLPPGGDDGAGHPRAHPLLRALEIDRGGASLGGLEELQKRVQALEGRREGSILKRSDAGAAEALDAGRAEAILKQAEDVARHLHRLQASEACVSQALDRVSQALGASIEELELGARSGGGNSGEETLPVPLPPPGEGEEPLPLPLPPPGEGEAPRHTRRRPRARRWRHMAAQAAPSDDDGGGGGGEGHPPRR